MAQRAEIIKSGTWFYAGAVRHEVWIVRQNFEYYYDEGFDRSERLNSDGELFAVIFAKDGEMTGQPSEFQTLREAVAAAESRAQGIQWDDHKICQLRNGRRYKMPEQ